MDTPAPIRRFTWFLSLVRAALLVVAVRFTVNPVVATAHVPAERTGMATRMPNVLRRSRGVPRPGNLGGGRLRGRARNSPACLRNHTA